MLLPFLKSSIGRKYIMALTGLAWYLFVLTHMAANLLILFNAEAYNKYSHALISNPLIYVAEAGLIATLLGHVVTGTSLTLRNLKSKPRQNAVKPKRIKGASLASKTMIFSGSLILVFVILHLITFKYGPVYTVNYGGIEIRDLHRLVLEVFYNPMYVIFYTICMVLLGFHLYHGISSSFQTLGINHPRWNGFIKGFGYVYSVFVAAGFVSQPLYVYFVAR